MGTGAGLAHGWVKLQNDAQGTPSVHNEAGFGFLSRIAVKYFDFYSF
jgi:hypothetical protein